MLLRSSSTPILNSWLSHSKDHQPEPEPLLHLPRTRSVNLSSLHTLVVDPTKKTTQFLVESDLQNPPIKPNKKTPIPQIKRKQSKNRAKEGKEQEEELKLIPMSSSSSTQRLFSSSGLGEKLMDDEACGVGKKESVLQTLTGGGGVRSNGGKICGGGGGSKGSDGGDQSGFFENNNNNNHGINNTDAYYQKMIQADPNNPLLLSNYAKFLKEVRGDYDKAEEYCGRAILANPNDAHVLSTYADLIWKTEKDAQRAENYYDQAVKASPDDSYVLASYARFLWDAEEDEEEDEGNERVQHGTDHSQTSSSNFFHGARHRSPLTAAS
ncbi:hypothetical protein M0R45_031562 [Rubus argutus]|uniref:Uncharacterized protein n=1 Tax=Rubus argutus TaxID=59490 RepID=A0AAW1WHZ5_RUBAR